MGCPAGALLTNDNLITIFQVGAAFLGMSCMVAWHGFGMLCSVLLPHHLMRVFWYAGDVWHALHHALHVLQLRCRRATALGTSKRRRAGTPAVRGVRARSRDVVLPTSLRAVEAAVACCATHPRSSPRSACAAPAHAPQSC